ncbi:testis-specific serine/threonine-protein kinase 6-like [Anopheles darlingi]|uniref:testis-specific serine/threonine-protein kinase 6-like n=1 Tax=Anopheles darlingi TaxID=43151 RepID=UPI002100049A|nr:testis-specific serine/threonine-protein kinase 6-like [Anopheles darlingi]
MWKSWIIDLVLWVKKIRSKIKAKKNRSSNFCYRSLSRTMVTKKTSVDNSGLETALFEAAGASESRRPSDTPSVLARHNITLGEIIGNGAFSCVKKGRALGYKDVAVKIISKNAATQNVLVKFMPRELGIIKMLRHKNIIIYYEYIETNMRYYIVMQYAENGSLLELLKKEIKLDEGRAWRYFHQLISAVKYIHSIGIVHRDIKCENIVFDARDRLKLIDFGFACHVNTKADGSVEMMMPTMSKTFCGSHAYASPEILRFAPYDPVPSDVWACGVVLFSMVCGKLPFTNAKVVSVLLKIMSEGPRYPKEVNVSDKLKCLLDEIFKPVEARITVAGIRKSNWFRTVPVTATNDSVKTVENAASRKEHIDQLPEKRFKLDNHVKRLF